MGFEWDDVQGAFAKVEEELQELRSVLTSADRGKVKDEFGDVLLPWSIVARYVKVDPEPALQDATNKFVQRFHFIEDQAAPGLSLKDMSLEEMDAIRDEAKATSARIPRPESVPAGAGQQIQE